MHEPLLSELYRSSASLGAFRGNFISTTHESLTIVYEDRIDLFCFASNKPQFIKSQRTRKGTQLACMIELPKNYLHNYVDFYSSDAVKRYGPIEVSERRKILSESSVNALVLLQRDGTMHISVCACMQGAFEWVDIAFYALESASEKEQALILHEASPFKKLLIDEQSKSIVVLEGHRWLHIMPIIVLRSEGISEESIQDKTSTNGFAPQAHDIESWESILGLAPTDEGLSGDAPFSNEVHVIPEQRGSDEALSQLIFFDFYPRPLIINAKTAYFKVDLHRLAQPVCSVLDCIALHGYTDPCFLFLYQPHMTWSGRMKLRAEKSTAERAVPTTGQNTSAEETTADTAFSAMSIDEGKRMLSSTVSALSLNLQSMIDSAEESEFVRVIWSLDNLPYNCSAMFLIPGSFDDSSPLAMHAPRECSVMLFSLNCIFFLPIAGKRKCFACALNCHGTEEISSEKNQHIVCPGRVHDNPNAEILNLSSLLLANCTPYPLDDKRFILFLKSGESILVTIGFSDGSKHLISEFLFSKLTASHKFPIVSGLLGLDAVPNMNPLEAGGERSLLITSLSGDTLIAKIHASNKDTIHVTSDIFSYGLCPIKDIEVLSGAMSRHGNEAYVAAASGSGSGGASLSLIRSAMMVESCTRIEMIQDSLDFISAIEVVGIHADRCWLICMASTKCTNFCVLTAKCFYDVSASLLQGASRSLNSPCQGFACFSTDPTLLFEDIEPLHNASTQRFIVQVTASAVYIYSRAEELWKMCVYWSVYDVIGDNRISIERVIRFKRRSNGDIPLLFQLSDGSFLMATLEICDQGSVVRISSPHAVKDGPCCPAFITSLVDRFLLVFCEKSFVPSLWALNQRASGFDIELMDRKEQPISALGVLQGKEIVEVRAHFSMLLIRVLNPHRLYLFQVSFCERFLQGKSTSPFSMFISLSATYPLTDMTAETMKIIWPMRMLPNEIAEGTRNQHVVFINDQRPLWAFSSKVTGEAFVQKQRSAYQSDAQTAVCYIGTMNDGTFKNSAAFHYFLSAGQSTLQVLRISALLDYGAPLPIRKLNYNQILDRLCLQNTEKVTDLSQICGVSGPAISWKSPGARRMSGIRQNIAERYAYFCVLEDNIENWSALDTNKKVKTTSIPPLRASFSSLSLWAFNHNGLVIRSDHRRFSLNESILCMKCVDIVVKNRGSRHLDYHESYETFLAIGSSSPVNEEHHCTGSLYILTVKPNNCNTSAQNNEPLTGKGSIFLAVECLQQGPVTALGSLSNGLLVYTVGSKIMLCDIEKQLRPCKVSNTANNGGSTFQTCYPYTHYKYDIVLLSFFYASSSIFVQQISTFGSFLALCDSEGRINVYRIDAYPKRARESSTISFSKAKDERGMSSFSHGEVLEETGSCIVKQIARYSVDQRNVQCAFFYDSFTENAAEAARNLYLLASDKSTGIRLLAYPHEDKKEVESRYKRNSSIRDLCTESIANIIGSVSFIKQSHLTASNIDYGAKCESLMSDKATTSANLIGTADGKIHILAFSPSKKRDEANSDQNCFSLLGSAISPDVGKVFDNGKSQTIRTSSFSDEFCV